MYKLFGFAVIGSLIVVAIILSVPIFSIFVILRILVAIIAKLFRPDLEKFVTGFSALFTLGKEANFPVNICLLLYVNGIVKEEEFRKDFKQRVLSLEKSPGEGIYDGLKFYCENFLGYPFWKRESNFDLKTHIRNYDYTGALSLSDAPTDFDLQNVLGGLLKFPWPKGQSPWEILIIHNFRGQAQTVLMVKMDHVLCDGCSALNLGKNLFQTEFRTPEIKLSRLEFSNFEKAGLVFKASADALAQTIYNLGSKKVSPFEVNSECDAILNFGVQVDVIKSIKKFYGVSYAAVLYSAMAGALVQALKKVSMDVPETYVPSVAIPKPNHPGGLSNHIYMVFPKLPLGEMCPEKRLLETQKSLQIAMKSTAPLYIDTLSKFATIIPFGYIGSLYKFGLVKFGVTSVGISNFPVSIAQEFYNGMEIFDGKSIVGTSGQTGILVSTFGVNNKQNICFCISKSIIPSGVSGSFGDFFAGEIQKLVTGMT